MHIALVSEHARPIFRAEVGSGQSVYIAELARALVGLGHRVDVHTRRDGSSNSHSDDHASGYRVVETAAGPAVPLRKPDMLQYTGVFGSGLRDHWERERPDLVHAHFWLSGIAAELAAREVGVPTVVTFHSLGSTKHRSGGTTNAYLDQRISLERRIARSADSIVATSTAEVDELNRMGVARGKVAVVPCGVDPSLFSPDGLGADKATGSKRIMCVGKMIPEQGFDTAIAMLPRIRDARLIIVGGPDAAGLDQHTEVRRLRTIAQRYGVSDRVTITGRVRMSDIPALLRSADVLVSAPRLESFDIASLHAMACGVPVVASGAGGTRDIVIEGITGEIVDNESAKSLAHKVEQLLRDEPMRFALGVAGADRAQSRYTWGRVAEDMARVYSRMAATDAAPDQLRSTPAEPVR